MIRKLVYARSQRPWKEEEKFKRDGVMKAQNTESPRATRVYTGNTLGWIIIKNGCCFVNWQNILSFIKEIPQNDNLHPLLKWSFHPNQLLLFNFLFVDPQVKLSLLPLETDRTGCSACGDICCAGLDLLFWWQLIQFNLLIKTGCRVWTR